MREITLGLRKARIWRGDLPNWTYPTTEIREHRLPQTHQHLEGVKYVALEMFVPIGGMAYYGGLG